MGDDAEDVIGVDFVRKSLQCALCLSLLEKPVQTPSRPKNFHPIARSAGKYSFFLLRGRP